MIKFKTSVQCPKVVIIVAAAANARESLGLPGDCYVTSLNDSQHSRGSLHYEDRAADFRVHGLSAAQVQSWAATCRKRLGRDYQVIVESLGTPNAHLHIEHDPK